MSNVTHRPELANGQLKFRKDKFRVEDIVEIGEMFYETPSGKNIESLAVRSCSEREWALVFNYRLADGPKAFDDFVYKLTDRLQRSYGRSFTGWDISKGLWIIKK